MYAVIFVLIVIITDCLGGAVILTCLWDEEEHFLTPTAPDKVRIFISKMYSS